MVNMIKSEPSAPAEPTAPPPITHSKTELAAKKRFIDVPKDGNCLFHAFLVASGIATDHLTLRNRVVDWLKDHAHEEDILLHMKYADGHKKFRLRKYLANMRKAGTFAGEPEIFALSNLYPFRIVIHPGKSAFGEGPELHLRLKHEHFTVLLP